MGKGIRNVWLHGCSIGTIAATVALGGGYLIHRCASRKQRNLKKVESIGTAFNAGYEVGKRWERGFQEYLNEHEDDLSDGEE